MSMHTLLSILLLLSVFTVCRGDDCHGNVTPVIILESVQLSCNTSSVRNSVWVKDSDIHIFIGRSPGNINTIENIRLGANYSLVIEGVVIENEGNYVCKIDGKISATYCVEVYVAPVLHIIIDSNVSRLTADVILGQQYQIECVASGSKPKTSLEWIINGRTAEGNTTETNTKGQNGTFNSAITFIYRFEKNVTQLMCVTQARYVHGVMSVSTTVYGYVVPELQILYKGRPSPATIYTAVNNTFLLTCRAIPSYQIINLTWIRNDHQLSEISDSVFENLTVRYKDRAKITLGMEIEPTHNETTIHITCASFGRSTLQRKTLSVFITVYQRPTVEILLNGVVIIARTTYVQLGSVQSIECVVNGTHVDFVSLNVTSTNEENSADASGTHILISYDKNNTIGRKAMVDIVARSEVTEIKCEAFSQLEEAHAFHHIMLKTMAVPSISFIFEEQIVQRFIHVVQGRSYKLTCTAVEANPKVQLTWVVDGPLVVERERFIASQPSVGKKSLWDSSSDLHFRLEANRAAVTCLTVEHSTILKVNQTIVILTLDKASVTPAILTLIFSAVFIGIVLATVILIYRLKFIKDAKSQVKVRHTAEPDSKMAVPETSEVHQKLQHKQSVSLPKPPQETTTATTSVEVYYSMLSEEFLIRNVYSKKDICFVAQLKKGTFLTRWIGTINKTQENKTCVFISLPTEDKEMRNEFQWDVYVQKLMEFPDHVNVIKTEGICIDRANIYLLQEYKPVGSLEDLLQICQINDGTVVSSDVLHLCLQVVKGMEFIVTHGFLHPGLSVERILATEKRCCKLYDFCLKEDASRKVIAIKKKETISELPIEAKTRNEYTWASDSWSMAICMWKIITYGTAQTIEHSLETQSSQYPVYFLECLLKSSSLDVLDRPPLRDLCGVLCTWMTGQNINIDAADLTSKSSCESVAEDGYTPMEGNIIAK